MTTDRILDKLAKLKASAESEAAIGNAAAAEAFAGMINAMLLRHELSMEDIPTGAREDDPIIEVLAKHDLKRTKTRVAWQETLASIVARAHLCRILVHPGSNLVTLVGTKTHVAVAEHAFAVLAGAADRMSFQAREDWWRTECDGRHLESGNFRAAWLTGFIGRISERFAEARRAEVANADAAARAAGTSCTALVRLDGAMVRVADHMKRYKGKASSVTMGTGNNDGYRQGRAAADAMKIGQQGAEGSARRQIT